MTLNYFNYKLTKLGAAFPFNILNVQGRLKRRYGLKPENIKLLNNPSNEHLFE